MLQLLQPIWLYAIAAIAIPIIIHLWDVRGGKKLKVGSILLIEESAKLQGRSLRLTELLLLILRCLLIILLAISLCKPVFKRQLTVAGEKGWLMIQREDLPNIYKLHRPLIDSLTKAGFRFHYFEKGFAEDELANAIQNADSLYREREADYWILLKQLNEVVPGELPVHVFAHKSLKGFNGRRPSLSMSLIWHGSTSKDTIRSAMAAVYKMHTDSIRVLTAHSSKKSLLFSRQTIAQDGDGPFTINNNRVTDKRAAVPMTLDVDTSGLEIIIFPDQNFADANFLKTALQAVQAYTQRNITIEIVTNAAEIKSKPDWLFWLSEKPVPVHASAKNLFLYATGKVQAVNSWIRTVSNAGVEQEPIVLSRRIQTPSNDKDSNIIWSDGFGNEILSLDKKSTSVYLFYSRLNPAWTDLPWSSYFAEMIFHLIIPLHDMGNKFDDRVISDKQAQPDMITDKKLFDNLKFTENIDLRKYVWLLAFLLFALERFLSLKDKRVYA